MKVLKKRNLLYQWRKAKNLVVRREMAKQREARMDCNEKELEAEMKHIQVLAQKRRKREEDRAAAQAEASRELEALEKEARKGHLSSSEVVEAADVLRARYGL